MPTDSVFLQCSLQCSVLPTAGLSSLHVAQIAAWLTNPGSAFNQQLRDGDYRKFGGTIAIVQCVKSDRPVGWARLSEWVHQRGDGGYVYRSVEGFTLLEYRMGGVCTLALSALAALSSAMDGGLLFSRERGLRNAVFSPEMASVCSKLGIPFVEFERCGDGWNDVRVEGYES